jgi:hypothetical protein
LRGWDSNPGSRAHEARGDGPSPTALGLVGRTRTCDLRFPKPVGCQAPLRPAEEPPAGLEPAASGLRVRRHPVSTTGANGSGGRGRTCASRVTVARLTARPRRNDGSSRSRTCEAVPALRLSKALPYRSAMLPEGRRGSRTPKALQAHPFSKRDTAPVAVLPVAPAGVEPATSRLRVGCSAELSYGAMTWPAGIEPAAPRVSGRRSTGLSYGHMVRWARLESNQRPPVCKTGARTS